VGVGESGRGAGADEDGMDGRARDGTTGGHHRPVEIEAGQPVDRMGCRPRDSCGEALARGADGPPRVCAGAGCLGPVVQCRGRRRRGRSFFYYYYFYCCKYEYILQLQEYRVQCFHRGVMFGLIWLAGNTADWFSMREKYYWLAG
jgi:hypothetical protein